MNINDRVHSWLLATDKTECRVSGEDELFQASDGFSRGWSMTTLCLVISQIPVDTRT